MKDLINLDERLKNIRRQLESFLNSEYLERDKEIIKEVIEQLNYILDDRK
jgi:hypothetical protein